MSLNLNPGESFPIVRVLKDPFDLDTHFVRAVIRDATSDALIATIDLDDKGSRRFQKVWKVTYGDAYSNGRYIVITTQVFDDSGYTTRSQNYAEEAETYLVQQRFAPGIFGVGAGGGEAIDYKKLREIIKEEVKEIVPTAPVILKQDFPIEKIIKSVKGQIDRIEIPEPIKPKEINLSPLEVGIEKIALAVKNIYIPKPEKQKEVDLSPILSGVSALDSSIKKLIQEEVKGMSEHMDDGKEEFMSVLVNAVALKVMEMMKTEQEKMILGEKESKRKNYLAGLKAQFQ